MSEVLEGVFIAQQLEAYQYFMRVAARFHSINVPEVMPHEEFTHEALFLISAFQKSYPFLDQETIHVFNEKICDPVLKFQRNSCLNDRARRDLYDELYDGLTIHVLPTAKKYLDKKYSYSFENEIK